ncbi:NAD(P)H-hydrate dehydratase [Sedimentibacter saalensis]|jgi:NAD(P)H-hydrate epimerase|uniref:ADP-dependent (S)-NAD(P)H-hydrate dehydratase n=1 Tax=Sedimentibacter saalensis TaxID=130788 RepID=A0A562J6A3_9FIRM|nr:NAD(P)H-hydrate dehydratase [Sedimentibacter saalensis]TWH78445.1 NAD(P)H-hydrate epimerase [Sedimentibacter saalensis]
MDKFILGIEDFVEPSQLKNNDAKLITIHDVREIITKRKRDSHKGTYGKAAFVSGSKGMAGAAVLNLNAALRSGSGLVKGFIPASIYNVVETMSLEAITHPFNEERLYFDEFSREVLSFADVVSTGSGCTNLFNYEKILNSLLDECLNPLVLDAEGINLLNLEKLKNHRQEIVLTPHYGEMARLLNKGVAEIRENIIETARSFSLFYNAYLVLKGARSLISCPDGSIFINTTGNPGMATAGSGDVLTGIITSFIGQQIDIKHALMAAVFIHGLAGDIAAKNVGEYSLIAGDIIKYLPEAFKEISAF